MSRHEEIVTVSGVTVTNFPSHKVRFPFSQKFQSFRNGNKWFGDILGNFPANPEIAEFRKSEPFNRKFRKFQDENQMENVFKNLGIPQEVVLFFWEIMQIRNFHSASELDIPHKDDGDAYSKMDSIANMPLSPTLK